MIVKELFSFQTRLLFGMLFLSLHLFSQQVLPYYNISLSVNHPAQANLNAWLIKTYATNLQLEAFHADSSLRAYHKSYWIKINNLKVNGALVKYNQLANGKTTLSYPLLPKWKQQIISGNNEQSRLFWLKNNPGLELLSSEPQWFFKGDSLVSQMVVRYRMNGIQYESVLNEQGVATQTWTKSLYNEPDSTVRVNIYLPDPITLAEASYGAPFIDNNDANNSALQAALQTDTLRIYWNESDSNWQLSSPYALATDFSGIFEPNNPNIPPPALQSLDSVALQLNRSQAHFEYFNVFYHLTRFKTYLNAIGFENLVNYPIAFDAHASTADQSSFEPLGVNSRLRFGDGGVDDAEDADVIIHEYGHAITNSAAPETNFGGERAALDEGFCDYLAISYSRRISTYQKELVFNWDGHNEFWDGRLTTQNRTYPTDKTFDIYDDGILWASALAEIADYIGLETTDRIAINATYSWFPNMLMIDAARLFLQSDTLLNDAEYSQIASIIFCKRGLLAGCEDTLLSSIPFNAPYLGNTESFAYNQEPLYIFPNGVNVSGFEVIDLHGRMLYEEQWQESNQRFYRYHGENLRQGTYILRLHTAEGPYAFKIIRTWL